MLQDYGLLESYGCLCLTKTRVNKIKKNKVFLFFILIIISSASLLCFKNTEKKYTLLEKQLLAQQFIRSQEGRFIYKAQHDGVCDTTKRLIYTIGFGTRSRVGEVITYEEGAHRFNEYLLKNVFPKLNNDASVGEYIGRASAIYRTGDNIKDCETTKKYVYITIKKNGKLKKVKSKSLEKRSQREYSICIDKDNEILKALKKGLEDE